MRFLLGIGDDIDARTAVREDAGRTLGIA